MRSLKNVRFAGGLTREHDNFDEDNQHKSLYNAKEFREFMNNEFV